MYHQERQEVPFCLLHMDTIFMIPSIPRSVTVLLKHIPYLVSTLMVSPKGRHSL